MLDNFDPKEKKVILIFIALLLLGVVYVGTHDMQVGQQQQPYNTPLPTEEDSNSGIYL
jgi:hypothetical protein